MPRKGENIYKRKDGRWEGRYVKGRDGKKAIYGYVYSKSYSEVKKQLILKRAEYALEENKPSASAMRNALFSELSEMWLRSIQASVKESTYVEPRTMQNRFKAIAERCGFRDAHFHTLRHTFATRCIEVGFDVKSLSEILGHANVSITLNRYVHPSMELKQKNMDKLSELFAVK